MNQDKAREYFSAYFEDNLEAGLKQSFEQRLLLDAQLQAEYRSFERTMEQLGQLKFEVIDVPIYLSDRIATRLEGVRQTEGRRNRFSLFLPRYGFALAAGLAIVGAVAAIYSQNGKTSRADIIPVSESDGQQPPAQNWPLETVGVVQQGRDAILRYTSASAHEMTILDSQGGVLKTVPIQPNAAYKTNLSNANSDPVTFEVKVSDSGIDEYVTVPGTATGASEPQSGSVTDFARAIAKRFAVPVVVNTHNLTKTVGWDLSAGDAKSVAQRVLDGTGYALAETSTGVLSISDQ